MYRHTHSFPYICMDTQHHTYIHTGRIFTGLHVHRHTHTCLFTHIHAYTWIHTHSFTHIPCSLPHSCFPSALSSAPARLPSRSLFHPYPGFPGRVGPPSPGPESCCASWWNRAQWKLGARFSDEALSIQGQTARVTSLYTLMIRCRKYQMK